MADELKDAPKGSRCDAEGCGQAVAIYTHSNGLNHCWTHRFWPESDDGLYRADLKNATVAAAARAAKKVG